MAVLDFPASPVDGQTYTANDYTWVYIAATTSWVKQYPPEVTEAMVLMYSVSFG